MENLSQQVIKKLLRNPSKTGFISLHPLFVLFFNSIVCSAIALFLWLIIGDLEGQPYREVWVYSQSIGQTLCVMLLAWSYYTENRSPIPKVVRVGIFISIVIIGYLIGNTLGGFINGHPLEIIPTESIFLISFVVSVFIAGASTWYYSTRVKLAKLQLRASEAQLSMLKAQIEPHMLFNTLANLRVLITKNPKDAQALLDQLIDFLRATLDGSRNAEGTVQEEFTILENYLSLMKIRFGDRLNYSLHLPDALANNKLPSLLLQPLVENAIKHGIEPFAETGQLDVNAEQSHGKLVLTVKNTGQAMDLSVKGDGFGLESVRERLRETYRSEASILFTSPLVDNISGTLVTITVPLNNG